MITLEDLRHALPLDTLLYLVDEEGVQGEGVAEVL